MKSPQVTESSVSDRHELTVAVKAAGVRAGFDLIGIAPAITPPGFERLKHWLDQGFSGEMQYLPRRADAYQHPEHVMPTVRSIVMLAINYKTDDPSLPGIPESSSSSSARVAQYARGTRDYHDLIRDKLKKLSEELHQLRPDCRTRGVVDTAPLLERDFARLAGLGWFGKNTMLINKRAGSWLFLAALLTDLDMETDSVHETSHCGTCTRCLDVCPTNAFPEPYVLDARRCISYLTIELRNAIPLDLRPGIGNWLFGCDLCQDVCPWNRKAGVTSEPAFQPRNDLNPANALEFFKLSEAEFDSRYSLTPLARPGWEGLRRNAAIVLGNSGDPAFIPVLDDGLKSASALVRESIEWAITQLRDRA
jgi:epoxyqueuosine reductase